MKVSFSFNVFVDDDLSGKNRFMIRLSKEFKKMGIDVVKENSDVHLLLPCDGPRQDSKINVLRLDGLILNSRWDYGHDNSKIVGCINSSDAVVYQGNFCKKAYENFLGISKENRVIPNGADPYEFNNNRNPSIFLANSKWRPHKRLKDIIKSFLLYREMGGSADLVVTGKPDYKTKHKNIKYVGWQDVNHIRHLLSISIASFHLTWLDWFPNSMVEAIVSKCPIIYTKSGGHDDVAQNSGIGIKDIDWNFKICDLYDPPPIDRNEVAKAMIESEKGKNIIGDRSDLFIGNVAKMYANYFEYLLKGKS